MVAQSYNAVHMSEQFESHLVDILGYCRSVASAARMDPLTSNLSLVPRQIGVYLWRHKESGKVAYAGRALGRGGLHDRIVRQHLGKGYSKSVLRRQLANEHGLRYKSESTQYLGEHFTFSFTVVPEHDRALVPSIEAMLILEYQPEYNRDGKPKARGATERHAPSNTSDSGPSSSDKDN